jgi:beta-lactamase superfamily II metal-dependent hydrolase
MDPLLRPEIFKFSIDEIYHSGKDYFSAHIIPETDSEFFPPYHLRTINFRPQFLTGQYFNYVRPESMEIPSDPFTGGIEQGAYYEIPSRRLLDPLSFYMGDQPIEKFSPFNDEVILGKDIFMDYKQKNNRDSVILDDIKFKPIESINAIKGSSNIEAVHLFCFYVGQGDTFLLITSAGNAYIIDCNFYSRKSLNDFVAKVQDYLSKLSLNPQKIKGLIITHKHIDHLRGADQLIKSGKFDIENFLINHDYSHPTKSVKNLLDAANGISNWININSSSQIREGDTHICIKNPDRITSTNLGAPDINDSSICLCIRYKANSIFLTGDATFEILNSHYSCRRLAAKKGKILKVSHHGSRTGTDDNLLKLLKPDYAFISAGYSRKYNHPHQETINSLSQIMPVPHLKISKNERRTIHYELTSNQINVNIIN